MVTTNNFKKRQFVEWYSGKIMEAFDKDQDLNAMIDINFKFSTMKLLHAKWISEGHNHMRLAAGNKIGVKTWKSSGIQYADLKQIQIFWMVLTLIER